MSQHRSRSDFIRFLDYLAEKGLLPPATAASRRTTANKVLSVLSDDDAADVTTLDLDDLMTRFDNLNRHQYTPESLQTYRSRLKTALEDFRNYCDNPVNFRPSGQTKSRQKSGDDKGKSNSITRAKPEQEQILSNVEQVRVQQLPNVSVLPIPIRADLTIQVVGLPFDLTIAEAKKIANIILAHSAAD